MAVNDFDYNHITKICLASGGSKNFKRGAEDNLSVPSSFIPNAHNELYAFYTEKAAF